ncbi:hypothetical protein Ocin01_00970 [Orchesella cincta]|uniref:Uncharacterized protein n=1 Tax=Orchesella cincta TaxID=48709 RepID=A0A1D2NKD5_ORCCI|nr:hypothetical protein Ocin01_00970 [Orchesella cincta]
MMMRMMTRRKIWTVMWVRKAHILMMRTQSMALHVAQLEFEIRAAGWEDLRVRR